MKDFHTIDLGTSGVYMSMKSLQQFISRNIPEAVQVDLQNVEMGYVEPGHGMKGKKVWLYTDGDLGNMYKRYQGKPSIRLWCYSTPKKDTSKPVSTISGSTSNKEEKQQKDVNEVYEELQEKHKGTYTPEQLRAWAHMIRLKTHDSLETPPDKPFFRGHKRKAVVDSQSPSGKVPESKRPAAISPGKKLNMRSELINQLEKWHNLLDSCVITQRDYDELKEKIMSDIKHL